MARWILVTSLALLLPEILQAVCPQKCSCKKMSETESFLKVKCGPQNKVFSIKELDFGDEAELIVQLDLSYNQINLIQNTDFSNFTNLKRLDLSSNSLSKIDETMFGEIPALERLKLSTNAIVHIFQGSFEKLKSLRQLNISGNPLACDCQLLWLVAWSNNMSVKLQGSPKCETPPSFKGLLLKKLKVGSDLHCESPLQPLLELKPEKDQLVFEGDELTLRCRAPRVAVSTPRDSEDLPARAHVFWGWSDKIVEPSSTEDIIYRDPSIYFPSIQIDAKHLSDSGLLDSILKIPYVTRNHTGMWDCRLSSQQANLSRSISVIVISEKTKYCPAKDIVTNKGTYFWPRTIRSRIVRLPCAGEAGANSYATYKCDDNGIWTELNTQSCPFISETTRILEQFSKVNLSIARGSVLESAKRLRNYTHSEENLLKLRDPVDLVFISKTLTNYLSFVSQEKDLGPMLLDIVSQLMILPSHLSQKAQIIESNSITKLIQSAENAAQYVLSSQSQKNNLAFEYFDVRADSFAGIACTWLRTDVDYVNSRFQCNTAKPIQVLGFNEHHVEASIQVPSTFREPQSSQQTEKLMIGVYKNSNFFPYFKNHTKYEITSSIIGIKLIGIRNANSNISDPISVMLRARPYHNEKSSPVPVWWDSDSNEWSDNVCQTSYYINGLLVFSCQRLGYYGLMQSKKFLNDFPDENAGAHFRLSPPAFYVGGVILFVCSWINIITYMSYGSSIQMARRQRHSLINTWIALSLLDFLFTIGIYQTEDYRMCQTFGISIHYLSLCVLLWVCVSVSNMYKRLSKNNRIPIDDLPKENIGRKPILGLYLVGWGIGLIICGISGAVNMREYASYSYCFLKTGPALSAIFVPSTILIGFLFILFICVRCHIRHVSDHNGHLSEGTQATENVDLELLDSAIQGNNLNQSDRYRSLSLSSPTTSMQEDLEHSNIAQLRAHLIFLSLYVATWASAAITVVTPFNAQIAYEEELFGIIYAISASLLGLFLLLFYSISRSDVRANWRTFNCRCSSSCCRSRSISDSKELNTVTYHQTSGGTLNSGSRSNSQCSKTRPSSATNHLKTHSELNSAATLGRNDSPHKLNVTSSANMNLVLVNRQQFVHNPVILTQEIPNPEIFYNPNQINVARKFFKKQKRLAKRNNFELQRQIERGDFGEGGSDISSSIGSFPKTRGMSIFSSGSKVNNTNIHVRALQGNDSGQFSKDGRHQNGNPNILSDSCNESDLIVDAERLVLGAEGLRVLSTRNKVNNTEMVANIYTNVPETQQPQHEIVTMRADDKFRKLVNVNDLLEEDEFDLERNDLNSQSDRTSTPLYVNGNIRNIMDEQQQEQRSTAETCLELQPRSNSPEHGEKLILSLNSPILAMNTIGLPTSINLTKTGENDNNNDDDDDTMNSSNDENILELDKNEAYISEALEISNRGIHHDDASTSIRIMFQQKKSKSLASLAGNIIYKGHNRQGFESEFNDSQVRSISCNNLYDALGDNGLGAIANPLPSKISQDKQRLLSSPVLFSPSLCEINDIPSPSIDIRRINIIGNDDDVDLLTGVAGSNEAKIYLDQTSGTINLFKQGIGRDFSSSPTNESDLNYQNSELSIRSHGLYAPQPDNDLNITLTGDEHIYYPYQSSEISDMDDEHEFDDYNTCSNDFLLPQDEKDQSGSHTSLDELYQQITRRGAVGTSRTELSSQVPCPNSSAAAVIISSSSNNDEIESGKSAPTVVIDDAMDFVTENDDDSSQCSIISFIDPNECGRA